MIHGDDFWGLGEKDKLQGLGVDLENHFQTQTVDVIGPGCKDSTVITANVAACSDPSQSFLSACSVREAVVLLCELEALDVTSFSSMGLRLAELVFCW